MFFSVAGPILNYFAGKRTVSLFYFRSRDVVGSISFTCLSCTVYLLNGFEFLATRALGRFKFFANEPSFSSPGLKSSSIVVCQHLVFLGLNDVASYIASCSFLC